MGADHYLSSSHHLYRTHQCMLTERPLGVRSLTDRVVTPSRRTARSTDAAARSPRAGSLSPSGSGLADADERRAAPARAKAEKESSGSARSRGPLGCLSPTNRRAQAHRRPNCWRGSAKCPRSLASANTGIWPERVNAVGEGMTGGPLWLAMDFVSPYRGSLKPALSRCAASDGRDTL